MRLDTDCRFTWNILLVFVLAFLAVACQTTAPQVPATLPVALHHLFNSCNPGDGSLSVQAFDEGVLQGSGDLNWVARDATDWDLELTNPLGATVLTLRHYGTTIRSSGQLAKYLPSLAVDGNDLMVIGGHTIGLKAYEVPCILSSSFPQSWLQSLTDRHDDKDGTVLEFSEASRHMTINLPTYTSGKQTCATISWRHFLFFRQELVWCLPKGRHGTGSLKGAGDYALKWVVLD